MLDERRTLRQSLLAIAFIVVVYGAWIVLSRKFGYLFLPYNIFLAIIPLIASIQLFRMTQLRDAPLSHIEKVGKWLLYPIWVFFYPNAPYMLTDLIHLSNNRYSIANPNYEPYSTESRFMYNPDGNLWYGFSIIAVGVIIGVLIGLLSLWLMHRIVRRKWNVIIGWSFVLAMHALGGFAIYLGRFLRWNSWDLFTDLSNIPTILFRDIHWESFQFTLLFAFVQLLLYCLFYAIIHFTSAAIRASANGNGPR